MRIIWFWIIVFVSMVICFTVGNFWGYHNGYIRGLDDFGQLLCDENIREGKNADDLR